MADMREQGPRRCGRASALAVPSHTGKCTCRTRPVSLFPPGSAGSGRRDPNPAGRQDGRADIGMAASSLPLALAPTRSALADLQIGRGVFSGLSASSGLGQTGVLAWAVRGTQATGGRGHAGQGGRWGLRRLGRPGLWRQEQGRGQAQKYDAWAAELRPPTWKASRYSVPTALAAGLFGRYVAAGRRRDPRRRLRHRPAGRACWSLLGYRALTGVDLSPEMLARAEARGVYRELRAMDLGARLDFADDRFAAATALGVLTPGHAPPTALDELLRVTRPGGHPDLHREPAGLRGLPASRQHMAAIDDSWRSGSRLETTPSFRAIPGSKIRRRYRGLLLRRYRVR